MGIDRAALVRRHNPTLDRVDPLSPFSVGNGEFAFTADVTGLQTFPDAYPQIPLCTQAQWGWHTAPLPPGLDPEGLRLEPYDTHGRPVGYPTNPRGQEPLFRWLRENPHRLHLGRIGLRLTYGGGRQAGVGDICQVHQTLDLWTGVLISHFTFDGVAVHVRTCVHPRRDLVAASIESPLLADGRLAVAVAFPYGSPGMEAADWASPERHRTAVALPAPGCVDFARHLDADAYGVGAAWAGAGRLEQEGPHRFLLRPAPGAERIEFVCAFSPTGPTATLPSAPEAEAACATHWRGFWSGGGAVELADSRDPRAFELERRIVLSQYLTAIHCAGTQPPQETGLMCNSWHGKFHLEMHWWHAAHFALWGRTALLERSLDWYRRILPAARATALAQGYAGARWPKMVGPDGRESPSSVGPLLIWQQPHPIALAELCYRERPEPATLTRYRDVVLQTAEFMADYAFWDDVSGRYVLGPPVIPAQENHGPAGACNPTFELGYWRHGLKLAQLWRERLGLPPEPRWAHVLERLSPLPVADGVYLAHENCPQTFTERNYDHPSMLAAFGLLPGDGVDTATMRRTLGRVRALWRWERTWGWDYPLVAMTAARLGEPQAAVDALLLATPKNTYLNNGHNWQRENLPVYLPGNGGLLAAVAMMAAGWAGSGERHAPGFPADGSWTVRQEGLRAWL